MGSLGSWCCLAGKGMELSFEFFFFPQIVGSHHQILVKVNLAKFILPLCRPSSQSRKGRTFSFTIFLITTRGLWEALCGTIASLGLFFFSDVIPGDE